MQFPHCDAMVLHGPEADCEYCNRRPDWQELRRVWDIAFTGEAPVGDQIQCPAERCRPIATIEKWGGNVATPGPPLHRIIESLRQLVKDFRD